MELSQEEKAKIVKAEKDVIAFGVAKLITRASRFSAWSWLGWPGVNVLTEFVIARTLTSLLKGVADAKQKPAGDPERVEVEQKIDDLRLMLDSRGTPI